MGGAVDVGGNRTLAGTFNSNIIGHVTGNVYANSGNLIGLINLNKSQAYQQYQLQARSNWYWSYNDGNSVKHQRQSKFSI